MSGVPSINFGIVAGLHTSVPPQDTTFQYFGDICNSPELMIFFNLLAAPPFPFIWDSDRGSLTYRAFNASLFIEFQKVFPAPGQGNVVLIVQPEIDPGTGRVNTSVQLQQVTVQAANYDSTIDWLSAVYDQIQSIAPFLTDLPAWDNLNIAALAAQVPVDKTLVMPPPWNNPAYAPMG